jgi:hypothetical protein
LIASFLEISCFPIKAVAKLGVLLKSQKLLNKKYSQKRCTVVNFYSFVLFFRLLMSVV